VANALVQGKERIKGEDGRAESYLKAKIYVKKNNFSRYSIRPFCWKWDYFIGCG
jgi:hypothetical protein